MVPQDPEDHPRCCAFVPARAVERGLRACARAVPGLGGRAVGGGGHPADRAVEGRAARLRRPGPVWRGLRLPVGRRHPRERPAGGAQAMPAGDDRGARRWPQGAGRSGRRLPRVRRVVGRSAARPRPPRDARPGACGRRRRAGLLERPAGSLPQGHSEDHRRCGGAARLLRLPGRALGAPAHHEPDGVDLRDRTAPDQDHQRARLTGGGPGDGVQGADRRAGRVPDRAAPHRHPPGIRPNPRLRRHHRAGPRPAGGL